MRWLLYPLTFAILVTVGAAREASADPVRVTFDDRNLQVFASVNELPTHTSEVGSHTLFASFDEAVTVGATEGSVNAKATATQRSSVSPTRYRAFGTAEAFENTPELGSSALTAADSFFSTSFVLLSPYHFVLSDFMTATSVHPHEASDKSQSFVALFSGTTASFVFIESFEGNGTRQLNLSGILPPGDYGFQAVATTGRFLQPSPSTGAPQSSHKSSFDLDFQLTPVPEPASMVLLGVVYWGYSG